MKQSRKVVIAVLALAVVAFGAVVLVAPRRAAGMADSADVKGMTYTLNVSLDNGSKISASFPGGELRLGKRCELRRKHLFAQWMFERYLDQ